MNYRGPTAYGQPMTHWLWPWATTAEWIMIRRERAIMEAILGGR